MIKWSALSSGEIDQHDWWRNSTFWSKYSNKQARITYSPFRKVLEGQTKTSKDQREKQRQTLYKYKSGNAYSFGKIINPADLFIKMKIMN